MANARRMSFPVLNGVYQEICPFDLWKSSRTPSHSQMNSATRPLNQWCDGLEVKSRRGEHLNRTTHPDSVPALCEEIVSGAGGDELMDATATTAE